MAALSARFEARAPEERAGIAAALKSGDNRTIVDRAHKLAGIAGMLGFGAVGEAALALEETARAGGDVAPPAARLFGLLEAL